MHRLPIVLLLGLVACVPDSGDEGILILKNVAPSEGCEVNPTGNEVGITHGNLSSAIATQYQFIAQMRSKITALEGQEDQRTVFTTGANVDLTFPDSTFFSDAEQADLKTQGVTHFRTLFATAIEPNGGLADAAFEITTRALYDAIWAKSPEAKVANSTTRFALEIVATIKVIGTMGGDEITSQPFQFPILISNDNLVSVIGECPVPADVEILYGNGCGRPQDKTVSCCTNAGALLCPPTVATMRQAPVP